MIGRRLALVYCLALPAHGWSEPFVAPLPIQGPVPAAVPMAAAAVTLTPLSTALVGAGPTASPVLGAAAVAMPAPLPLALPMSMVASPQARPVAGLAPLAAPEPERAGSNLATTRRALEVGGAELARPEAHGQLVLGNLFEAHSNPTVGRLAIAGRAAEPSGSGGRAAGVLGRALGRPRSMLSGPAVEEALSAPERALVRKLVRAAAAMREAVPMELDSAVDGLSLAIFTGQFSEARTLLAELEKADFEPSSKWLKFYAARRYIAKRLPASDSKHAGVLHREVSEILSNPVGDPLALQSRLTRMTGDMSRWTTPKLLERFQHEHSMRHSWLARERGEERQGAPTGPAQEYNDCKIRSLYDLPIAALDALRKAMPYSEFLNRVAAHFPHRDVKKVGLATEYLPRLMEKLGLKWTRRDVNEVELVRLLERHGSVIAAFGWFEKGSLDGGNPVAAWDRFVSHAAVITGVERADGGRLFVVRDPGLDHEVRYTFDELRLMLLRVDVIEPLVGGERSLQTFVEKLPWQR